MPAAPPPPTSPGRLGPLGIRPGEHAAVIAAFAFFFCLFASYFMLRPVRETMGIAGGVQNLQWLFTATFVVMLAAIPLYGLCSARLPRRRFVPWVYAFFIANLLAFALATRARPDDVWLARVFYVWLSVFNLFVVSVAWSLMADVFRPEQARRLFPVIAAGASVGGLAGPLLSGWLVGPIGLTGLMLLSAVLLAATLPGCAWLFRWRARAGAGAGADAGTRAIARGDGAPIGDAAPHAHAARDDPRNPIGGGLLAGLTLIARSRYLLGIALFVILLSTASTFLYFEQARLVAETFPDRTEQTRVFSALDAIVQAATIAIQLFFSGRVARRYGVTALLTVVPLAVAFGFVLLAIWPVFGVLAGVMVLRRVGEYALVRPGREMLFTVVDAETKYKAKNVIDTMVYRAGDAVSAWVKTGIDALAGHPAVVAVTGAVLALVWGLLGWWLGRRHQGAAGDAPARTASTATQAPARMPGR
ncbi:NTP/NDP exchange transporter [Cupriavidus sp. UGS-1]|uniref:NTP/NDP exchange transporter n=1 Tax=Cupriavidus sp. UGS-1 TaxID=2899826 RepID=UPI001E45E01B|nr:MFS transporter [Cupriavidus sp. UGS-1]MCD9123521.1 MFS transporter [Cupriavidus sp. UGS-1]